MGRFTVVKDTRAEQAKNPQKSPKSRKSPPKSPKSQKLRRSPRASVKKSNGSSIIQVRKSSPKKRAQKGKELGEFDTDYLDIHHVVKGQGFVYNGKILVIEKILGSGAFGSVFKVRDEQNQQFSLKVMNLPEDDYKRNRTTNNFMRELQMLRGLNRKGCERNMICLVSFSQNQNQLFLLTKYVEGIPLQEVRQRYKMNRQEFLHIFEKTVRQYSKIKALGIVHKDIKPQNILYDVKHDTITIIDVGLGCFSVYMEFLSMYENELFECMPEFSGTLGFLAPEVIQMQVPTYHSDIFSLGVTMFYLLTGQHLFGNDKNKMNENTRMGRKTWYGMKRTVPDICQLIDEMTAVDPEMRPSLRQIVDRIQKLKSMKVKTY